MSFEILMGTFAIGIAAMLGIMGFRQWNMGYRIAGGLSLITATLILVGAVAAVVYLL